MYRPLVILLLLITISHPSTARDKKLKNITWQTSAQRTIAIPYPDSTMLPDSTLAGTLSWMAAEGKLNVYRKYPDPNKPLSHAQITEMLVKNDTTITENPLTQKLDTQIRITKKHFETMRRWVFEELWTFSETEGILQVNILNAGPRVEIYDDYGEYRGTITLFLFRWDDIKDIVTRYSPKHPQQDIYKAYIDDITDDRGVGSSFQTTRDIKLFDTISEYQGNVLRRNYPGYCITESLTHDILEKEIKPYRLKGDDLVRMSLDTVKDLVTTKFDTMELEDPVTGQILTKVLEREFKYYNVCRYRLLQNCVVNKAGNGLSFKIRAVAPLYDSYKDGYFPNIPMYWIKYKDIIPYFTHYQQLTPHFGFSSALWDSIILEQAKGWKKGFLESGR